jgi:hypothetical protein
LNRLSELGLAIAVQVNSSDVRALGLRPRQMLLELARVAVREGRDRP